MKNTFIEDVESYHVIMGNEFARGTLSVPRNYHIVCVIAYAIAHIRNSYVAAGKRELGDVAFKTITFHIDELNEFLPEGRKITERIARSVPTRAAGAYIKMEGTKNTTYPIFAKLEYSCKEITVMLNDLISPFLLDITQYTDVKLVNLVSIYEQQERNLYLYIMSQTGNKIKVLPEELYDIVGLNIPYRTSAGVQDVIEGLNDAKVGDAKFIDVTYVRGLLSWSRHAQTPTEVMKVRASREKKRLEYEKEPHEWV